MNRRGSQVAGGEMTQARAERAMKLLGIGQTAIGLVTLLTPARRTNLGGMRWSQMTGEGHLGWRLFALRQILLGVGVVGGVEAVRNANWLLQPADLALFVRAYQTESVPRRTSILCLAQPRPRWGPWRSAFAR